jgi:hypothetical protein
MWIDASLHIKSLVLDLQEEPASSKDLQILSYGLPGGVVLLMGQAVTDLPTETG